MASGVVVSFPYLLDLLGTFVFALSGAVAAVKHRLDLFGILFLSFIASSTGGIIRDLLIGAVPPGAINDWRYIASAMAAGILTFCLPAQVMARSDPVQLFDAGGLALFAVTGAHKALLFGLNPVMATLLGMLTGIGGGMARDLLLSEIPVVLRAELYAVAALLGAGIVVGASLLHLPSGPAVLVGAGACFLLRVVAMKRHWRLPIARTPT